MIALVVVLGVLYLAVCGLLFVKQRSLVFPAPVERVVSPGTTMITVPGATFYEWSPAAGEGPVVVHFHGNGEQVAYLSWLANTWRGHGVSFAAVEYPGYPAAGGSPSEESILAAAEAAVRHLVEVQHVDRARLVLVGQSLGSGVAMQLAAKGWGARVVLLTPYTALPDVGASAFPMFPVRLLMRDRFDSMAVASSVKQPVLVVHGTADEVIPFVQGQTLAAAIAGSRFVEVPGGHHNDLWDRAEVLSTIVQFVGG